MQLEKKLVMATILTGCSSAQACITSYAPYTATSAKDEFRIARAFFRLCDTDPICYTVEQEMCDAIEAGTMRILDCGKGTFSEPTQNTETDDYGCSDSSFVKDYSMTLEFFVRYDPNNEAFMKQICEGNYAEFGWVSCCNLTYVAPSDVEISAVGPIDDGGFKAFKITATWTQKCGIVDSLPARAPLAYV